MSEEGVAALAEEGVVVDDGGVFGGEFAGGEVAFVGAVALAIPPIARGKLHQRYHASTLRLLEIPV